MVKKAVKVLAIAGILAAMPVFAFAAGSVHHSSGGGGGRGGSSSSVSSGTIVAGTGAVGPAGSVSPTAVNVNASGAQYTNAGTITNSQGYIAIVTSGTTSQGLTRTYNQSNGNALYGGTEIEVRKGSSAVAGLSETVKSTNSAIETSRKMEAAVPGTENTSNIAEGFNLNTLNAETGLVDDSMIEITFFVSYLTEDMKNLTFGGYCNDSSVYVKCQIINVDYARKEITVLVPGSGTYWLAN